MRPRGSQDEAKMTSRRVPWRRLGGLGPLGPLLGRSWVVLGASWQAPGGSWSSLGGSWLPGRAWGSFGLPGGLRLELLGPLLKAPLRNRENLEIR